MKPSKFVRFTFRKTYIQIAAMLMLSTLIVLVLMALVYVQLKIQLNTDGVTSLRNETSEVQEFVQDGVTESLQKAEQGLSDDRGQNVYFVITQSNKTVFESSPSPVPIAALNSFVSHQSALVFHYKDKPYRILHYPWSYQNKVYQVYIYKLIVQEYELLQHVRVLMVVAGTIGIVMTVGINLWIAYRALTPARRTWLAHQDMMRELSHELQTPLATIHAVASSNTVDAHTRTSLMTEASYASSMVKDILYLSNLQTRLHQQQNQPVAVSDVTEEVVGRFQELAASKGILLQGHVIPGLYVNTTLERWSRLISTLLKNVVDHGVPQTTATWELKTQQHFVEFTITNESGTTQETQRGLGLLIANRLAEDMAGTIQMVQEGNSMKTVVRVPWLKRRSL